MPHSERCHVKHPTGRFKALQNSCKEGAPWHGRSCAQRAVQQREVEGQQDQLRQPGQRDALRLPHAPLSATKSAALRARALYAHMAGIKQACMQLCLGPQTAFK